MRKIIVTRYTNYARPGTPLTFEVSANPEPQTLPKDVADYIIKIGAGHKVERDPDDKSGGVAAKIARKRKS